jgi:hypothetical protein
MERKVGELLAGYMYVLVGKINSIVSFAVRACVRTVAPPRLVERNKN